MSKRYILGVGNYSKTDDGVGLHIVEYIHDHQLATTFEAIDIANRGIEILSFFTPETEKIIIVDCGDIQRQPGDYLFFSPAEVKTKKKLDRSTTHESDVLQWIEMGLTLNTVIPIISILAIQPLDTQTFSMQLSPCLQERLEEYVTALVLEINR